MAATMSPWAKPGAWALDSEEHEAELLQQQQQQQQEKEKDTFDFPSLSAAAAATKQPKKKKGQTISLAEFSTYGGPKPPSRTSEPVGLTHEDRLILPTGPRERSAEELDSNRLGGGFRSFDRINRGGGGGGDDSSNSRWGPSRGSDRNGGGGFGRESNRDLGPSRADEVDNWATAKKPSVVGNGFERRERDRDRGGFFDSQSKADESESWVSNKSFTPSEGRRFGGGDRERRGGGFTSNGGGADSDFWGKKREESNGGIGNEGGSGRPRLNLQPRTLPINNATSPGSGTAAKPKGASPFGEARPREEVLAEKGRDWKKIDEQLDSMKIKEAAERAEGGSSFGKRSFGNGNARSGDRTEMSWRKPDGAEDAASSESAEKVEDGPAEEN